MRFELYKIDNGWMLEYEELLLLLEGGVRGGIVFCDTLDTACEKIKGLSKGKL